MCIFIQDLYTKLNRVASIASEMFVGRERFATLLLMRLTETVILWLSEDQTFWEDIEEGPRPLGSLGLQQVWKIDNLNIHRCSMLHELWISVFVYPLILVQFYLDMKFVVCFASQGRYLSRNLHRVVNDIISKAMAAFSATGMDPNRYRTIVSYVFV